MQDFAYTFINPRHPAGSILGAAATSVIQFSVPLTRTKLREPAIGTTAVMRT
jgi:hypothetical protein